MVLNIEKTFFNIGLHFNSDLGTFVHKKTGLPLTVRYDNDKQKIVLLDQTKIPFEVAVWTTSDWREAAFSGIKNMIVRGSQAIGCAAAYCMVLAANACVPFGKNFLSELKKAAKTIETARPTASPLRWAVSATLQAAEKQFQISGKVNDAVQAVKDAADHILTTDLIMCSYLRQEGQKYINDGDVILTHCNAGSLSSSYGGHALGIFEEASVKGKNILVVSKETRPRSQGFKLTTWELLTAKVPVVIITDNMVSSVISRYNINKIMVGADRVAKNGALANKIGTHDLALIASSFNIPFYVATGYSTIDLDTRTGSEIPIEERDPDEILYPYRLEAQEKIRHKTLSKNALKQWPPVKQTSRKKIPRKGKISIYNPAFDITPPHLIRKYITDIGSYKPDEIKKMNKKVIDAKVQERLKAWEV